MPCVRASIAPSFATLAVSLALAGCGQSNTYVAPPPPKVTVAPPVQRAVTLYLNATGNTAAVNTADLVARVPGFVQTINYEDGALVKKGTLLFTIEPESYELKVKQSQAAEVAAGATLKQAQADFQRQTTLAAQGNASKATLDTSTATRDSAQANLQQAEINTKLAAINYGYTNVAAPFDGTVTARKVSIGDYVGANSAPTVLATIVQSDPIYVNFNVDEQDVIRIREQIRGARPDAGRPQEGAGRGRSADRGGLSAQGPSRLRLAHRRLLDRHARRARRSGPIPSTFCCPACSCVCGCHGSEMEQGSAGARQRARQRSRRPLFAGGQ